MYLRVGRRLNRVLLSKVKSLLSKYKNLLSEMDFLLSTPFFFYQKSFDIFKYTIELLEMCMYYRFFIAKNNPFPCDPVIVQVVPAAGKTSGWLTVHPQKKMVCTAFMSDVQQRVLKN
jgi:hypothetical protein